MLNLKLAFGKRLKQIRKSKNISQEKLAEMIGVNPRQVSKIETGSHFPNCTTLENICTALSISPKYLFNFELTECTKETGTGDIYTYNAVVEGNVVYLDNNKFRKQKVERINSANDIDTKMITLARKTGKSITVKYYHDGEVSRIIEYQADGTYKILKDNTLGNSEKLLNEIKDDILHKDMTDYYQLAKDALTSNEALEKLQLMLSGIKMGRK